VLMSACQRIAGGASCACVWVSRLNSVARAQGDRQARWGTARNLRGLHCQSAFNPRYGNLLMHASCGNARRETGYIYAGRRCLSQGLDHADFVAAGVRMQARRNMCKRLGLRLAFGGSYFCCS
jgi:hypothetical protein